MRGRKDQAKTTISETLSWTLYYSQEALADKLSITRQTILKYETGEATPSMDILKQLSNILQVDYTCLIEDRMPEEPEYRIVPESKSAVKNELRISIPQRNIEKFKQVLLYILQKVGAKPNIGETVIYKLLYFIDFDYYELYEEQLMGLKYIKNTYGPTPVDFAKLVTKMEEKGELEKVSTKFFDKDQKKYLPVKSPNLSMLTGCELQHIDRVLERLSDKTATELSELSHKDIPWIGTKMREVIDYEAVFYRTSDTSVHPDAKVV